LLDGHFEHPEAIVAPVPFREIPIGVIGVHRIFPQPAEEFGKMSLVG
jgi:hypothetical protein